MREGRQAGGSGLCRQLTGLLDATTSRCKGGLSPQPAGVGAGEQQGPSEK